MSTTTPSWLAPATDVPLCEPCATSAGLCHWHAENDHQLMPLLRECSWHRVVHRGENTHGEKKDAATKKAERKTERKKNQRFGRAMAGEFTRTRLAA